MVRPLPVTPPSENTDNKMAPELGRIWFRIALIFILGSGLLLLFQQPGTAEFIVTTCTLGIGIFMALLIILVVKLFQ